MRLFLHIGAEKTGTTTIQEALYQNKGRLIDQGFHFLQSAGDRNNRMIPAYCMADDKYDDFFLDQKITTLHGKNSFKNAFYDAFKSEVTGLPKNIHTVIISSEHLHSRTTTKEEVENVKKLLGTIFEDIKIICYVREQSASAISLYSTAIKVGHVTSLRAMLSGCNPDSIYYNYYAMLSNWRDVFGADSLIVRKFEKAKFKNNDLIDDFFSLIDGGLNECISKNISIQNESLSALGLFLGLAINQAFPKSHDAGLESPIRKGAVDAISQSFKGGCLALTGNEYDEIYTSFEDSNIKLNEEFLGGLKGVNCFDRKPPQAEGNKAFLEEGDIPKLVDVFKIIEAQIKAGSP